MGIVPMDEGDHQIAAGIALCRPVPAASTGNRQHAHAFHQVTLILSRPGHVEWHLGENLAYSGRPAIGDVVVAPASLPILVRWERPFESVSVRISTDLLDAVAEQADLGPFAVRPVAMRRDRFAGEVVRKLAEEAPASRVGQGLFAESLGTTLALHLLREYGTAGNQEGRQVAGLPAAWLRRVTEHIEGNIDGHLSIDRLAAVAGLSPYHFIRQFRAAVGTTPHQYVIRRRVERASELLLGGFGIAEVAARVGFSGQSHLHHHLRRLQGVTPGELLGARSSPTGRPR